MYKVHPPMPASLSAEAQTFLLRTFEPDPRLRASAQALLGDPFLQPGKRSRSPSSPQHVPRPSGAVGRRGEGRGLRRSRADSPALPSLPQESLQPVPLPRLTPPPRPRPFQVLRHPLRALPAPRSAALVMGAPASSGENLGSSWSVFAFILLPDKALLRAWASGSLTRVAFGVYLCPLSGTFTPTVSPQCKAGLFLIPLK